MGYRILLLHDNHHEVDAFRTIVEGKGHQLKAISSILEAMNWLNEKDHIDVAVSNVHLENESVFEFLKQIKGNHHHNWMQFIMLCSEPGDLAQFVNKQIEQAAYMLGADKYIIMAEFSAERLLKEIEASMPNQPPQHVQDPIGDALRIPRAAQDVDNAIEKYGDTLSVNVRKNVED